MAPGRRAAEIMIEGDDAVHLGARDVQRFGENRLGCRVDVAEFFLQGLEDGQQRAFQLTVLRDDFAGAIRAPRLADRHLTHSMLTTGCDASLRCHSGAGEAGTRNP
jgi:hypothetical protein